MNDETSGDKPTENHGPVDPEVVRRAKEEANDTSRSAQRERIDPDAPERGVFFAEEDAPEPNEPGKRPASAALGQADGSRRKRKQGCPSQRAKKAGARSRVRRLGRPGRSRRSSVQSERLS
jgi:hypothetical protein